MIRDEVKKIVEGIAGGEAHLERPNNTEFGDYSTNIALRTKTDPKKIIGKLKDNPIFEKVDRNAA